MNRACRAWRRTCVRDMCASCGVAPQIHSVNAAAAKIFGYGTRDLIGRNISSVIPEPIASVHGKYVARARFVCLRHACKGCTRR